MAVEETPRAGFGWTVFSLVGISAWVGATVYAIFAFGAVFATADDVLVPLGLRVAATPDLGATVAAGRLIGPVVYAGRRHGRPVSITQTPDSATTVIGLTTPTIERTVTSASEMSALTGEPANAWRSVKAVVEGDTIVVHRSGNGAGRWLLHDLVPAERLAGPAGTAD